MSFPSATPDLQVNGGGGAKNNDDMKKKQVEKSTITIKMTKEKKNIEHESKYVTEGGKIMESKSDAEKGKTEENQKETESETVLHNLDLDFGRVGESVHQGGEQEEE